MLCLLLACAATFPGGPPGDLAAAIRSGLAHDTLLVYGQTGKTVPAFDLDTSNLYNLNMSMRSPTRLSVIPGSEPVFSDGWIPTNLMPNPRSRANVPQVSIKKEDVKEGKLTFATKGDHALNLKDLTANSPFDRPVSIHWFLQEYQVYADARDASANAFLTLMAQGLGGDFTETKGRYSIDLDPGATKRRIVASLNKDAVSPEARSEAGESDRETFASAVVNTLNTTQMRALLKSRSSQITIPIGSGLNQAATRFVEAMISDARQPSTRGRSRNRNRLPTNLLSRIDPSRTATATIDARFRATLSVPIMGGSTVTVR